MRRNESSAGIFVLIILLGIYYYVSKAVVGIFYFLLVAGLIVCSIWLVVQVIKWGIKCVKERKFFRLVLVFLLILIFL